jgi:hypothetical protein
MVKKKASKKAKKKEANRKSKITAQTPYGECRERMTAFGGLLTLEKLMDLISFEAAFKQGYVHPKRIPKLGNCLMIKGILILLFIGFQRLGHFSYIQTDAIICGIMNVPVLPVISTYWRYLRSIGIMQSQAIVRISGVLRERVWELCDYKPKEVTVLIDTTVATVYGEIEGAKRGHNTKHRGKKGLRSVLLFLQETQEYLCGSQRRGETIKNTEVVYQIKRIRGLVPNCVKTIRIVGDGEFIGWSAIKQCKKEGFEYTFGNKRCNPPFVEEGWYREGEYDYNECHYQPAGWEGACRFVVMRIRKDQKDNRQLSLFEDDTYMYRVFVTSSAAKPHCVIAQYDKRANVENMIKEAQHEGILAIPSKKFSMNHAYFQIVMLAINLWRWMKMLSSHNERLSKELPLCSLPDIRIRTARLKMLFIAAKIRFHSNQNEVLYSIHDARTSGIIDFLAYLDKRRKEVRHAA